MYEWRVPVWRREHSVEFLFGGGVAPEVDGAGRGHPHQVGSQAPEQSRRTLVHPNMPETSPDFKGSGWRGPGVRDGDGVHSTIVRGSVHKLGSSVWEGRQFCFDWSAWLRLCGVEDGGGGPEVPLPAGQQVGRVLGPEHWPVGHFMNIGPRLVLVCGRAGGRAISIVLLGLGGRLRQADRLQARVEPGVGGLQPGLDDLEGTGEDCACRSTNTSCDKMN